MKFPPAADNCPTAGAGDREALSLGAVASCVDRKRSPRPTDLIPPSLPASSQESSDSLWPARVDAAPHRAKAAQVDCGRSCKQAVMAASDGGATLRISSGGLG